MGVNGDVHIVSKPGRSGGATACNLPCLTVGLLTLLFLAFRRFTAAGSGSISDFRGLTGIALANARSLAAQFAQVIKLRASYVTFFHHVDVIDDSCMQRKNSFDADAKAGLTHGDRLAHAAMLARNANAFECL